LEFPVRVREYFIMAPDITEPSVWSQNIARTISDLKCRLKPGQVKEYQLDLLVRLAKRCDYLARGCASCQDYKKQIDGILPYLVNIPLSKVRSKEYLRMTGCLITHLKKAHHLASDGQNLSIWLGVGLIAGGVTGLVAGNPSLGATIGLVSGATIGLLLDYRLKLKGRII
jgi:hypothetical protein